jgi:hypothetical protein
VHFFSFQAYRKSVPFIFIRKRVSTEEASWKEVHDIKKPITLWTGLSRVIIINILIIFI